MASLPKTYKAVVLREPNAGFNIEEVELKQPGPNEVLVKVLACGVCQSDYGLYQGHYGTAMFPRIPGHEIVGDVAAVGSNVTRFTGGERVGGAWHGGHDGECKPCQKAMFQMCVNRQVNGVSKDGGYAEYVLLRQEVVVRVPKELDPAETAPLMCAGVTVFNSIRKKHVEQGALVAVQGLGGLGHLAVQYARAMGYEVVVLSGGDKEAFAKELGAHHFIDSKKNDGPAELMKMGGAQIIVQTAPDPALIGGLVNGLAAGGTILSLAPVGPVSFDTVKLVQQGASIQGWPSGHAVDSEEAIAFAQRHNIKCMVERFPFADVQKAADSLAAGKPRFRNVLVME